MKLIIDESGAPSAWQSICLQAQNQTQQFGQGRAVAGNGKRPNARQAGDFVAVSWRKR